MTHVKIIYMEICGILLELNHNSDVEIQYIHHIKESYPNALLIVFLSSDFNLFGEPSRKDKYQRTLLALNQKVDCVIEIPNLIALQNLDESMKSLSTIILNADIDQLFLISESMQINYILQMVELPIKVDRLPLKSYLKENHDEKISYTFGPFYPHDLLAISLIRQIKTSKIKLHFIKQMIDASVSYEMENYYPYLRSFLMLSSVSTLQNYAGISDGYAKKLKEAASLQLNFLSFKDALISKFTQTHQLQKMLIQVMAQNTSINPLEAFEPYLRVLGFNKRGQAYLKTLKDQNIRVISSFKQMPKKLKTLAFQYRQVYVLAFPSQNQKKLLALELGSPIKKD